MTPSTAMILTIPILLAACNSGPIPVEKTTGKLGGPTSIRLHASEGGIRISSQASSHKITCRNCGVDLELIVPAGTTIDLTMVNGATNFTKSRGWVNASSVHGNDTDRQVLRSLPIRIFKGFAGSIWKHLTTVFISDHGDQIDSPEIASRSKVAARSAGSSFGTR